MKWSRSGVTLIEIMMVLAIIAIIGTISLPRFDRVLETYKLKTDARQVAWVLRSARQEAITSGITQMVTFKPNLKCYIKDGTTSATYKLSPDIVFPPLEYTFEKQGGYPVCGFKPTGAVTPKAGKITLKNKYGKRISVIVNPSAGRIRIQE